ncbi:hypothetical protein [Ferrimonas senticii]|uniref:hypothetical protein n=1 Tax=Ferrimonas senticii TaxID=394566 RepID=UPI00040FAC8B|nr:hypothetical protein [Ferrimonas senticii]
MTLRVSIYLLALLSMAAQAKIDGTIYLGQGLAYSDGSNMIAPEGDWETQLQEVAINANWRINPRWRIAGQATWRQLGLLSDEDPAIDYLFAQYRHPLSSGQLSATAGRYKIPQGWYNASRDSAFSRPSILLPGSIYREWSRDAQLRRDGLLLQGLHYLGEQSLTWNVSYGDMHFSDEFNTTLVGVEGVFDTSSDGAWDLSIEWQYQPWLQLKYSYVNTEVSLINNFTQPTPIFTPSSRNEVDTHLLSWRSDLGNWQLTAEYLNQRMDVELIDFGLTVPQDSEGGYLQARYLAGDGWQWFGRYDIYYPNRDDRDGAQVTPPAPAYAAYAKTWSSGISWQFQRNWQLSAEWHYTEGGALLPRWQLLLPGQQKYSNLLLLQLAYRWNWSL